MDTNSKNYSAKIAQYVIGYSFMTIFIVIALSIFIRIVSPDKYNVINIDDGWTDSNGKPFSLEDFNSYDGENMLPQKVYRYINVSSPDTSIIFRCRNCYCNTYINGQLVHKDNTLTPTLYGSSPGSRWHIIALDSSDKPIELCLEVTACFHDSDGLIDNIYTGTAQDVYRKITTERLAGFLISVFLHLTSIIMILLYAYLKKRHRIKRDMLYLGIATFFSAQWSSSESLLWQLFVGYSEVFHLIGYISLAAIPLAFGVLAYHRLKGSINLFCIFYSFISAVNMITITLLHITGIYEFHYSLPFTHVLIVILIPLMIKVVLSYTKSNADNNNLLIYILLFTIIACLITALVKYNLGSYGDYSSYIRISILCFLFCLIIYQMNQIATTFSKGLKADMLHDLALTDHMTGLYNRTAFSEHSIEYNHMIDSFSPVGIIQFDVNNLKTINDTMGHEKGDQLIILVANGLKLAFGENCKTYRTGGDEFLTIIESLDPCAVYQEGINKLQKYCDGQNRNTELGFNIHIAHGFVLVKGNMSLTEAIDAADALMYENKREIKENQKDIKNEQEI